MKILVTGGLGYIGSHTILSLLAQHHEVVILDNLDNSRIEVLHRLTHLAGQSIPFYQLDITNPSDLNRLFEQENLDGIIHFAAKKSVSEAIEKPLHYYQHNIVGLLNLLEACERYEVNRFIFSSSCTVYGTPKMLPVTETTSTQIALSPYGNSKRIGEELLQEYASLKKNFKTIILRYFNPVGAHPSGTLGELPLGVPANLMPFITQSAAGIKGPLQVFGSDYNTTDGTAIRDYIHVIDLALAHIEALQYLETMPTNVDLFNVGTGEGVSVLQMIQTFEQANNIELNYEFAPRRAGDIEKIWADTRKITEVLGWRPKYDLRDMCLSAWQWQQFLMKSGEDEKPTGGPQNQ